MRKLYATVGINSTPTILSFYHNVRDMLTPGKYDQYKATLDEAYDALVKVEEALDGLGLKLEYQHWRISSAFEELKPLLIQPRSREDMALEAYEQDLERKQGGLY